MLRSEVVNLREMRITGLSRSGNHAVIQWIFHQVVGRACFLNCVEPKTNPFLTAREMGDGSRALTNFEGFDLAEESQGKHASKDLLMYSYEDCFLSTVCHPDYEKARAEYLGPSHQLHDVLILRDPFNLFASRIRSRFGGVTVKTAKRIWMQHAKQFLRRRNYVTQEFVPVSFNQWAVNQDYRRNLAETLQLEFDDEAAYHIPSTGGGSSFSGRDLHGEAHRLNITGRWRHFQNDAEYCGIFDADMIRLSDEIFGDVEDSDEFRDFRKRLLSE